MDYNTSGTNWGSNISGTTFTAVDTPTLESLSGGVRWFKCNYWTKENCLRKI